VPYLFQSHSAVWAKGKGKDKGPSALFSQPFQPWPGTHPSHPRPCAGFWLPWSWRANKTPQIWPLSW